MIPKGNSREEVKIRERLIKDFYAGWIAKNPEKKVWNENLQDYILVKFLSINMVCPTYFESSFFSSDSGKTLL